MNSLELIMAEKNLKGLLLHTLKDVYFAEHEILKALPQMAQAAQSAELKQAFETHRAQTEQQIARLDDVFALLNEKPAGVPCKAIQGILAEDLLDETLAEEKETDALLTQLAENQANVESA
jgi:ferritin-like metal-binding protein YciE